MGSGQPQSHTAGTMSYPHANVIDGLLLALSGKSATVPAAIIR